jgi:hypothetical protein
MRKLIRLRSRDSCGRDFGVEVTQRLAGPACCIRGPPDSALPQHAYNPARMDASTASTASNEQGSLEQRVDAM